MLRMDTSAEIGGEEHIVDASFFGVELLKMVPIPNAPPLSFAGESDDGVK